jgi:hypothetical protein
MWLYLAPLVLGAYDPCIGDEIEGTVWIQGTFIRAIDLTGASFPSRRKRA